MKQLLTFLVILLSAGFSCKSLAMDTFDVSAVNGFDAVVQEDAGASDVAPARTTPLGLFAQALRNMAESTLVTDFVGSRPVHGQPLPGVLISLLLGAAFGAAKKLRVRRDAPESESTATDTLPLAARLLRMNVLFLNPPQTIHTVSPGPDLFCLRE